jgi:hypothetical protein
MDIFIIILDPEPNHEQNSSLISDPDPVSLKQIISDPDESGSAPQHRKRDI